MRIPRQSVTYASSIDQTGQMSTKIQLNPSSVEKEIAVHVLPCHIAYDGPSKVSHHFKPRIDMADKTISTCCFRGRKLCGRTISLPPNYFGTPFEFGAYAGH